MLKDHIHDLHSLDTRVAEDSLAAFVDSIKQAVENNQLDPNELTEIGKLLIGLLDERHLMYNGRSTNQTIRMRGYILASLEKIGLPDLGLPFVLEELESGRDAYLVAAAAKAVRAISNPTSQLVPYLFKAVENIKLVDDSVTFEQYKPHWPLANYTTALTELFQTFGWLGSVEPAARRTALDGLEALVGEEHTKLSQQTKMEINEAIKKIKTAMTVQEVQPAQECECGCCSEPEKLAPMPQLQFQSVTLFSSHQMRRMIGDQSKISTVNSIELQDQNGVVTTYNEFFRGKPSVIAFFYTRCNNPNKCSLTITKLGRLQKALAVEGMDTKIRIAAISYDPDYDLPPRLEAYGLNRDFTFTNDHRIFRAVSNFQELEHNFKLRVNFTGTTVNRHALELFILSPSGEVAMELARLQWDVEHVLANLTSILNTTDMNLLTVQEH